MNEVSIPKTSIPEWAKRINFGESVTVVYACNGKTPPMPPPHVISVPNQKIPSYKEIPEIITCEQHGIKASLVAVYNPKKPGRRST